jgi:hypothetical protein
MDIKYECKLCGDLNVDNFYKSSSTRCKKCKIKQSNEWINKNFIKSQLLQAKHRAKRDGICFFLTQDIIEKKLMEQNHKCKISKIPLEYSNNKWNSLSFDRLDSNIGYTENNTIMVTKFLNNSKNVHSLDEYEKILKETYTGIFGKNL